MQRYKVQWDRVTTIEHIKDILRAIDPAWDSRSELGQAGPLVELEEVPAPVVIGEVWKV
jgi:hypothetical protein